MRLILLLLAALALSGCCGRGLWYSSPSRSGWCALLPLPAPVFPALA